MQLSSTLLQPKRQPQPNTLIHSPTQEKKKNWYLGILFSTLLPMVKNYFKNSPHLHVHSNQSNKYLRISHFIPNSITFPRCRIKPSLGTGDFTFLFASEICFLLILVPTYIQYKSTWGEVWQWLAKWQWFYTGTLSLICLIWHEQWKMINKGFYPQRPGTQQFMSHLLFNSLLTSEFLHM